MIVERARRADSGVLTGFVLPKFTDGNGPSVPRRGRRRRRGARGRRLLRDAGAGVAGDRIDAETRPRDAARRAPGARRATATHVLAVRIGATDLSGRTGCARSRELTVYDVALLADVIGDVVNVLGRADDGYVVTGPVWEYFSGSERIFKPQLRESPFVAHDERTLRAELIAEDLDGLIREVALDQANGLTGKTVIHPSHVAAVHALSVVSHEEYLDATDILGTAQAGGVSASAYRQQDEREQAAHRLGAPHAAAGARVRCGPAEDVSFVDLLAASLHQ